MKFELKEYAGCFAIELSADTLDEAAQLVKLKANTTKELRSVDSYVGGGNAGTPIFRSSIVIAKKKGASDFARIKN